MQCICMICIFISYYIHNIYIYFQERNEIKDMRDLYSNRKLYALLAQVTNIVAMSGWKILPLLCLGPP